MVRKPEEEPETIPKCWQQREDYFECLHGRKQYLRIKEVYEEDEKQKREAAEQGHH
jgi:hypothetical protein